jgi:hypothetical protein
VAWILEPHVNRVVVVSPGDTGITSARPKTDKLDARTLSSLLWKGEREAVWMPDERCRILRRRLARREQLVRSRSRAKNEVHATLHVPDRANLRPKPDGPSPVPFHASRTGSLALTRASRSRCAAASSCCARAAGSLGRMERLTFPVSPRRQRTKEHRTVIRYDAALVSGGGDAGPKGEAM